MYDTVNQRFEKEWERLKSEGFIKSDDDMSEKTGIKRSKFSMMRTGGQGVDVEALRQIKDAVNNFDIMYVIMGNEFKTNGIQGAFAGGEGDYDNVLEVKEGGWDDVKRLVQKNSSDIHIFQVVGDSMAPTLWNDDILFAIAHKKGEDEIRNTYIYVIESPERKKST